MLIDWFTVGAQAINFIILVWLMKYFLYQPILDAIDARETKITNELSQADKISQEANQAKASFEKKNADFEQQREQLMTAAKEAAEAERQRLSEEARLGAEQLKYKQQQAFQTKLAELQHSIRRAAQKELFTIAKDALQDLANVSIEAQMVAVFLNQLDSMDGEEKAALKTALKKSQIKVLSSGLLSTQQQQAIEQALDEFLGYDCQCTFEQSADLIGGIELRTEGFKVGWSVAEYLVSLEELLAENFKTHTAATATDANGSDKTKPDTDTIKPKLLTKPAPTTQSLTQ